MPIAIEGPDSRARADTYVPTPHGRGSSLQPNLNDLGGRGRREESTSMMRAVISSNTIPAANHINQSDLCSIMLIEATDDCCSADSL